MDIKQRVMDDQPNSWLHKIARIVPGFKGYVDRERRRDADKLLRTHIAKQFSSQRDRLNRVQQSLLRARRMDAIGEVDRLAGVLQRLIDRINMATYGYTGMFDPVKIEAEDLDQLYAFDMSLASGVDQVAAAIGSLEDGQGDDIGNGVSRLSTLLDELNERMNQRSELLTSGTRIPQGEFQSLLDTLEPIPPYKPGNEGSGGASGASGAGERTGGDMPDRGMESERGAAASRNEGGYSPGGSMGMAGAGQQPREVEPGMGMSMGAGAGSASDAPLSSDMGSDYARVSGSGDEEAGVPTLNLSRTGPQPPGPGLSSLSEGNQGFGEMPRGTEMSGMAGGPMPVGDRAGSSSGIESASSPAAAPGAPGHDVVEGLSMERNMERAGDVDKEGGTVGT